MKYIPLRVKTSYFLLTSMNDIHKMVLFCKEKGINTLCITDPNMYGVMEFYNECKNNGIKPVIGLELNIDNNIVILYAKDYSGYQNLTKLVYIKQNENITIEILNKYNSNLICVSTMDLSNIYSDFYYGYTKIEDRKYDNSVYINNILCLNKEDMEYLKYLHLIKNNKKITDEIDFKVDSNSYFDFKDYDYDNSKELVDKCNIEFIQNKKLMPKYDVDNSKEYLLNLCKKGLYKRLDGKITKIYYDRLLYELDVIDKMGFNDYFLVVWDYVKFSKKNNILIGSGRGSAAGSLVSYCLGITDVDPIKYDLLFERFLNIERITMPDIDIDFEASRREEVVRYVIDKYGKLSVTPIITFSTLSGKQVLRDVARIFDINTNMQDMLSKYIDSNIKLKDALNNINLKDFLNQNPKLKNIYKIALKLEGLKRQISVHAAGVLISACDLSNYVPLEKYDDYYLCAYDKDYLEELGLIKMDFLSLKNLDLISNVLKSINKDFKSLPIDDKDAIKLFYNATTCGIFQFESTGMKKFLTKFRPSNFDDIVACIALFRPGPSSNIDSYIRRKNKLEKIDYIHPSLEKILKPTYGIIIYQEQIMQIANIMAGYSYGEADVLRRAMSKKKKEILESEKDKFIENSIKRGYSKEVAEKTYNYILKFADYGFNKAHSIGYSMIALKMAYLKVHYKEYFMSYLLTNVIGNEVKTKEYINECRKMNINILKPNINLSNHEYISEKDGIRFSLSTIRNVGSITCKEIIKERENGKFIDFFDFVKRCYGRSVNKKTIESLIDADVFSDFGFNHNTLYYNIDSAINYAMLSKDLDESLIDKPIIEEQIEYDNIELGKREKDVFGFYLTNHPVTKYKARYNNIIDLNEITNYFDKMVNVVIYVNRINITKTKGNEDMAFINGSDEYDEVSITVFPDKYPLIENINTKDILLINGKVEKRFNKYQIVLYDLKKL